MQVSEARLAANRLNSTRSTGPRTPEGKAISRQNSLKHGLTGAGIVVPEEDRTEIDQRIEELTEDMKPGSPAGALLIAQMATLSVRVERSAHQETASLAHRVRHAADAFDEERIEQASQLLQGLADDPRNNLRKLRKSPEGVERLIEAWRDLRADLTTDPRPVWTAEHLEKAASLTGLKPQHARGSRFGALSRGFWGDFAGLAETDGGDLGAEPRQAWSKAALLERIDAEITSLEAHYETLDFETIELDRAEAGARALFDPSREATLARRYEAQSRRDFFKALKEFRQVEAESAAKVGPPPAPPQAVGPRSEMASSCNPARPPDSRPPLTFPEPSGAATQGARYPDGRPAVLGEPKKSPG